MRLAQCCRRYVDYTPVGDFTNQLQIIVATKGVARSYIEFHKDVKTLHKYATHYKVYGFYMGKIQNLCNLAKGQKWS